jgi:hypothetical protein
VSQQDRGSLIGVLSERDTLTQALLEEEMRDVETKNYAILFTEAFDSLSEELNNNGQTDMFDQLRASHSKKILTFWQRRMQVYDDAQADGLQQGEELSTDRERIRVTPIKDGNHVKIWVYRTSANGVDNFTFSVYDGNKLDQPPLIKSEIFLHGNMGLDMLAEVSFSRAGLISTMDRVDFIQDKRQGGQRITQARKLDFSLLQRA